MGGASQIQQCAPLALEEENSSLRDLARDLATELQLAHRRVAEVDASALRCTHEQLGEAARQLREDLEQARATAVKSQQRVSVLERQQREVSGRRLPCRPASKQAVEPSCVARSWFKLD